MWGSSAKHVYTVMMTLSTSSSPTRPMMRPRMKAGTKSTTTSSSVVASVDTEEGDEPWRSILKRMYEIATPMKPIPTLPAVTAPAMMSSTMMSRSPDSARSSKALRHDSKKSFPYTATCTKPYALNCPRTTSTTLEMAPRICRVPDRLNRIHPVVTLRNLDIDTKKHPTQIDPSDVVAERLKAVAVGAGRLLAKYQWEMVPMVVHAAMYFATMKIQKSISTCRKSTNPERRPLTLTKMNPHIMNHPAWNTAVPSATFLRLGYLRTSPAAAVSIITASGNFVRMIIR
mmetsp:Transcript_31628/g.100854  ORF Transcript_31628/g.100854 Transcript_31628/m.100854 type:complete len:286 (+) Transcript_31628:542-1399(+)